MLGRYDLVLLWTKVLEQGQAKTNTKHLQHLKWFYLNNP